MGLGKTLQSIALLYTLLQGWDGEKAGAAVIKRCIVVCPCSLVRNWAAEFDKWINNRVKDSKSRRVESIALSETAKATVEAQIEMFLSVRNFHKVRERRTS
jgi:DNA repair and recombination RAD54-like protein